MGAQQSCTGCDEYSFSILPKTTKNDKIFTVVLTGGPCAGKTSSLENFTTALKERGYDVYATPEVPTILMAPPGGCVFPGGDPENADKLIAFETNLMKLQIQLEETFIGIAASTGNKSVVVMDRGLMDVQAYLNADQWKSILDANNMTEDMMAERYDFALHLCTTAKGVEEIYERERANNPARSEDAAAARWLDDRILTCYEAHPNRVISENSPDTGFKEKLDQCTNALLVALGETPAPPDKPGSRTMSIMM